MRKHGLTIDNLLAVEIVTADGRSLRASEDENSDLFWGIRGGGGNFGIVTTFEYRLHPVGPIVLAGPVVYTLDKAKEVLRFVRDFMETAPDDLTVFTAFVTVPPVAPFPEHLWGQRVVAVDICYAGDSAEGERVVQPLRSFGSPDIDLVGPMPYVVRQSMLDETVPHGLHFYDKFHYLCTMKDSAIEDVIAQFAKVENPLAHIVLGRMGGAVARVAADATAFQHRDAPYLMWVIGAWRPEDEAEPNIEWVRGVWEAMRPYSNGAAYVNALGVDDQHRVRVAYGANYDRLVDLKNRYDPTNFFRLNPNIAPSA
jgi:FAD/FMN-containing dehydrogenase